MERNGIEEYMEGLFLGWNTAKKPMVGIIKPDDGSEGLVVRENEVSDPNQFVASTRVKFTAQGIPPSKRKAQNIQIVNHVSVEKIVRRGRVVKWDTRGFGYITPDDASQEEPDVYVKAKLLPKTENGYLSEGLLVEFDQQESTSKDGKKQFYASNISVVGWGKCGDCLGNFADLGHPDWYTTCLEKLAAESEDGKDAWNYKYSQTSESLPILRSYIRHTFQRLEESEEGKGIIYTGKGKDAAAAFNTGLVTKHREEIFGLFRPNDVTDRQLWKFSKFCMQSDREFLNKFGSKEIPLANYFDDPSILIFDRRCKLHIYWEHIFDDEHLKRFPENLRDDLTRLRRYLDSAKTDVEWRLARNYRLAIPQYFRDRGRDGSIQLLLPICLDHDDYTKVDIALVAEKIISEDGEPVYRCSTVLPLDWAYNNARLLVRPDTGWLQP